MNLNRQADPFPQDAAHLEPEDIARLQNDTDVPRIAAAWLESLARLSPWLRQGLVVVSGTGKTRFAPVAVWPQGATPAPEVLRAVEGALRASHMVIETASDGRIAMALPIWIGGLLRGATAVLAAPEAAGGGRRVMDQLTWASGWIEAALRRQRETGAENLVTVIELLATSLHHPRFAEAATAVATELAGALDCELVGIGLLRGRRTRMRALSNSATFGKTANLVRAMEAAMDEAIDQECVVVFPSPEGAPARVLRAHQALSNLAVGAPLATVPLTEQGRIIGAILLEGTAGRPFDPGRLRMAEQAAVLVGPVLDIKRREDRWLPAKAWDALGNLLGALFGRRHAALKLTVAGLAAALAFAWFATGTYRITAETVVEGRIQRVVTAPLQGFLLQAEVRAGDIVDEGQVLARLDDRDLRLERLKWIGERTQAQHKYSQALARRDRTETLLLTSQIEQADAQIALLDQQLDRMTVTAPFSGVVVSGDLTQQLGAPVERGAVLFEVAPLDEYRVILRVDERDITDVTVGQTGALVLSALPDADFRVEVRRITPVSSTLEGANVFDVEAGVAGGPTALLRPGMEGVAKIDVDQRRVVTIWTRRIVHWVRMTLWSWVP